MNRIPSVLVTGATGFIGSAVAARLISEASPGAEVRLVARRPPEDDQRRQVRWVPADLTGPTALEEALDGVSTVVHLAARVNGDEEACNALNVTATRRLIEHARASGVTRLVYMSTCAVYGEGPHRGGPVPSLQIAPVSVASRTRSLAERSVLDAGGIVLRPNLVIGRGDRWVVPSLVRIVRAVPAVVDDGQARVSLVAVEDLAAVTVAAAAGTLPDGSVVHVNHPEPMSMAVLLELLAHHVEAPRAQLSYTRTEHRRRVSSALPRLTDHQHTMFAVDGWYDSEEVWERTGVSPGPGVSARLAEAAPWYRAHLRQMRSTSLPTVPPDSRSACAASASESG